MQDAPLTCFGCGTLVEPPDVTFVVVAGVRSRERAPFHAWCVRTSPPYARSWSACAVCAGPIDPKLAEDSAAWLVSFEQRTQGVHALARPPVPLRFVRPPASFMADRLPPMTVFGLPRLGESRSLEEQALRSTFELVHLECLRLPPAS